MEGLASPEQSLFYLLLKYRHPALVLYTMESRKSLSLTKYIRAIRNSPREIYNRSLFLSVCSFALGGCAKGDVSK